MIEHEGRQYNDTVLRPYQFTKRLLGHFRYLALYAGFTGTQIVAVFL